jgi:hypothetical protein
MGALLSAVVSMSDHAVSMQLGVPKVQLLQSFQQGAESALYRANFLRTTKLQTLQALVMYLVSVLLLAKIPANINRSLSAEGRLHVLILL